jgi:hypothetical protein
MLPMMLGMAFGIFGYFSNLSWPLERGGTKPVVGPASAGAHSSMGNEADAKQPVGGSDLNN